MNSEREAFEKVIKEDRYDTASRFKFSDWLEEHGFDDEAVEQRRMATAEWVQADKDLHHFADECGHNCYAGDETPENRMTYEMVIQAGYTYIKTGGYFIQYGNEDARNMMYTKKVRDKFWKNWQIVTGVKVEEDKQGTVFSCSC